MTLKFIRIFSDDKSRCVTDVNEGEKKKKVSIINRRGRRTRVSVDRLLEIEEEDSRSAGILRYISKDPEKNPGGIFYLFVGRGETI